MKAILEFDLSEDRCEHIIAVHAMDFALTCHDLDEQLRQWMKYGNEFKTPDDALDATREVLRNILSSRGISLNMIE